VDEARVRLEDAELALRLYWLAAVHPKLDANRTRHDWLSAALVRSRLRGAAVELYRRELEADPDAALSGRYVRLLEAEAVAGDVLALARLRLVSAGAARAWHVIDADLATLAGRVGEFDEGAWLAYLAGAATALAFERPAPATERCRDLLAGLRHLELRQVWAFDMIDEHEMLAREWRDAYQVPAAIREAVRLAWSAGYGAWRKALPGAAAWAATDPAGALRQFDLAAPRQACLRVLTAFQRLLDEGRPDGVSPYPPNLVRGLAREFLARNAYSGYASIRADLLSMLVAESIDPQELAQACFADRDGTSRWLASEVRHDATLRLAWRTATA
jgi:hypothetical protein